MVCWWKHRANWRKRPARGSVREDDFAFSKAGDRDGDEDTTLNGDILLSMPRRNHSQLDKQPLHWCTLNMLTTAKQPLVACLQSNHNSRLNGTDFKPQKTNTAAFTTLPLTELDDTESLFGNTRMNFQTIDSMIAEGAS